MDLLGDYEDSGDEKETQLPVGPAPVGPAIPTEEDLASLDQLLHNHEIHKTTHEIKRDKEEVEKKPSRPPPPGMKRKREMDTGTELKQRLEKPARIEVAGLNLKDKKVLKFRPICLRLIARVR